MDAVLATDPEVARIAFPFVDRSFPGAIRIGCDGDYHLEPEWKMVELDAIVVAHPGLGTDLPQVREGRARSFIGGPVTAGAEVVGKRLGGEQILDAALPARSSSASPGSIPATSTRLRLFLSCRWLDPGIDSLVAVSSRRRRTAGVDELVRARAGTYGLRGKRPKSEADLEAWIRGSALLVGFPSPAESAAAVAGGVPLLFVTPESRLLDGDRFLVQRGALISEVPITIAVHVEGLLPGGSDRATAPSDALQRPRGRSGPRARRRPCSRR